MAYSEAFHRCREKRCEKRHSCRIITEYSEHRSKIWSITFDIWLSASIFNLTEWLGFQSYKSQVIFKSFPVETGQMSSDRDQGRVAHIKETCRNQERTRGTLHQSHQFGNVRWPKPLQTQIFVMANDLRWRSFGSYPPAHSWTLDPADATDPSTAPVFRSLLQVVPSHPNSYQFLPPVFPCLFMSFHVFEVFATLVESTFCAFNPASITPLMTTASKTPQSLFMKEGV